MKTAAYITPPFFLPFARLATGGFQNTDTKKRPCPVAFSCLPPRGLSAWRLARGPDAAPQALDLKTVPDQHQGSDYQKNRVPRAFHEHNGLDGEIPGHDAHQEIDGRHGIVEGGG
jgi:hypothetical protein